MRLLDRQKRPLACAQCRARWCVGHRLHRRIAKDLALVDGARDDVDIVRIDVVEGLVLEPLLIDDVRLDEVHLEVLGKPEPHELDELLLGEVRRSQRRDADSGAVRYREDRRSDAASQRARAAGSLRPPRRDRRRTSRRSRRRAGLGGSCAPFSSATARRRDSRASRPRCRRARGGSPSRARRSGRGACRASA